MSPITALRPPQAASLPEPVGLREMVAIAFRYRWRILAASLIPPAIAIALVVFLPKVYRAETEILVKTGREYLAQADNESALTAPSSTKQEEINSEIELLGSRVVAERTIRAIGLGVLYPNIVADPPSRGTPMDAAVLHFDKDFSVTPVKLSNMIAVSFDASSATLAQTVLDTVIRLYIDEHRRVFAGSRAEGYEDSIDQVMAQIRTLEEHRSQLKLQSGIFDIAGQRQALIAQRADAQNKLADALGRQVMLTAKIASLQAAYAKIPATIATVTTAPNDNGVHARDALIDLRQQESSLAARYGDGNPDLRRVRSQIATLQHTVGANRAERNQVSTSPSTLRQQLEQEIIMDQADLQTAAPEITRLRSLAAARDAELRRLERADLDLRTTVLKIDVLTDNLKAMQDRYERARAQEQTALARQVSVIPVSKAMASEVPVKPSRLIFGLAGALGGILLAGFLAVLCILMSKTAVTKDAAERVLGLPVLAVMPVRHRRSGLATPELD